MARTAIYTDKVGLHIPAPIRSRPVWSLGTRVGNFVFTAGQPGVDASGKIVSADVKEQTFQAYENLRAILEEGGLSFGDVAKIRIFVTKREDYEKMTEVRTPYYAEHFPDGDYPASTALITPLVVDGLLVEVEAIACANKRCFDTDDIVKLIPLPLAAQPLWRLGAETEDLLWTTGQPGFDLEAKVVGPDVASQTRQSLKNMRSIVEAGGFAVSEIAKLTTFLADPADFPAMLEVRNEFLVEHFPNGDYPASSTVVGGFPPEPMRVEIEAIAAKGPRRVVSSADVFEKIPVGLDYQPRYSQAVRAGDWVFVSGQGALDQAGDVVGKGDVRAQTTRALENVEAVLNRAGAGFQDVAHISVYLASAELYEQLNEARTPFYQARFPEGDLPASTAVVAPSPLDDILVEFEVIAHAPE